MQNTIRPSWLHRLLGKTPGEISTSVLSSSGCSADLVSGILFAICTLPAFPITFLLIELTEKGHTVAKWIIPLQFLLLLIVLFVGEHFIIEPCRTIERKARAIRRRAQTGE